MPEQDALHLSRWTVTSGNNAKSRGAVVIEAGDHHWQASASGNGAVDALFKAVDKALMQATVGKARSLGARRVVVRANEGTPPPRAAQLRAAAAPPMAKTA